MPDLPPAPPAQLQPVRSWGKLDLADRQRRIQALAARALELRAQRLPGVQLWSELTRSAVAAYADAEIPPALRADFVIEDLALVILGPSALKYMGWFEKITPPALRDPLLASFYADFGRLGLPPLEPAQAWRQAGYVGKVNDLLDPGLDRHFGRDFRLALNDKSDNQIFHTFFYQFIAYLTRSPLTIRAGSVYHELFERGGSVQDHNAALTGIEVGRSLRRLRDSADPELEIWPELMLAAYARQAPARLSPPALALRRRIDELLTHPTGLDITLRSFEYGTIVIMNSRPPAQSP